MEKQNNSECCFGGRSLGNIISIVLSAASIVLSLVSLVVFLKLENED